jgi:hypothetical protein
MQYHGPTPDQPRSQRLWAGQLVTASDRGGELAAHELEWPEGIHAFTAFPLEIARRSHAEQHAFLRGPA